MIHLGILLTNDFRLLSVAAIIDVFESVNRFYLEDSKDQVFNIRLICADTAVSKLQPTFPGHTVVPVSTAGKQDLIFIPAFTPTDLSVTLQNNGIFMQWLQQQVKRGASVASVCTGAFLLGASGLLDGKFATTHVDACPAFAAAFPAVKLQPDKIVTGDDGIYTSGGATSSFHLMLHLLQQYCGREIAIKTAKLFAIDMDRNHQAYFSRFLPSQNHRDELVVQTQQSIEASYQDAATIEEIIKDIPASRRNIARRFKQFTGITPIEYLQNKNRSCKKVAGRNQPADDGSDVKLGLQ